MTLFDWLNEITYKKSSPDTFSEEDWKSFNSYLIHRYVSMEPGYIDIVNILQKIPYTDKKQTYIAYKNMIPMKKIFLKYIGPKSSKKDNNELISHLSNHFECSLSEAQEYTDILGEDGTIYYMKKFGIETKQKKKKKK